MRFAGSNTLNTDFLGWAHVSGYTAVAGTPRKQFTPGIRRSERA